MKNLWHLPYLVALERQYREGKNYKKPNSPNTQLNLLFVDMESDAIQLWANRQQIPLALVHSQQITLQDGTQQYDTLTVKKKHTPLLLLSNGKASQVVDMGRF